MGVRSGATIVTFLLLSIFQAGLNQAAKPEQFHEWSRRLSESDVSQQKVTQLHFYSHNTFRGENSTALQVAEAPGTNSSPTAFGLVVITDDPLTEGPDPGSRLVGRAQGLFASAGQGKLAVITALSYWFTDGEYNGSTLSFNGLNPALDPVREIPIVGGTGAFRLARGVAILKTYLLKEHNAIVEYNVTVVH